MKRSLLFLIPLVIISAVPTAAEEGSYTPALERVRAGLASQVQLSDREISPEPTKTKSAAARTQARFEPVRERRDSVWNGALIGAAAGAGGGYVWAHNLCGANDAECFAIAGPVGILTGAGIGAAVGAIVDLLHR